LQKQDDMMLGLEWLTMHHATIDSQEGDIPETGD